MVDYALESGGVCAALRPLPNPGLRTSQPSGTCWGSCAARQAGHIGRSHPASNSELTTEASDSPGKAGPAPSQLLCGLT